MKKFELMQGDCLELMRGMADASVDSIVTDPPYELGFMGKSWDASGVAFNADVWREALRVLKPGGHLLAFSGSRTYHRMVCAIEDAGFEIRDQIMWLYGSGFPKSKNLNGEWEGWGTALKPAHEPIVVARKPLVGTVAANVLTHGTGALNIDGCRVATDDKLGGGGEKAETSAKFTNEGWKRPWMNDPVALEAHAAKVRANVEKAELLGRWPANVIHDGSDEVLAGFPVVKARGNKGESKSRGAKKEDVYSGGWGSKNCGEQFNHDPVGTTGSAARFFYCAKASKKDRGEGNTHPTVKPTDLMRYLCRLVTPPGGLVLDPFMGSGSTGKAAMLEGFRFVGIELSEEYIEIARARIATAAAANDNAPPATEAAA